MASRDGDRGVLLYDDYWYFPASVSVDPAALSTFLTLRTPFFVEKYIKNDDAFTVPEKKRVYTEDDPPDHL